jgi:hypothetical protein
MHQAHPVASIGSGLTQTTSSQASNGVAIKLFATDKENNCGATHQMIGKMSKSGTTLRHANTSDCMVVDHPSSKLVAQEHQMEEVSEMDASISGVAASL